MKIYLSLIILIISSIVLNIINYNYFLTLLSITWYLVSILIIYSSIKFTIKYKFLQINIPKIIEAIKSKSKNNISPLSSLCISLAAKIGVGSLSGVALAIYFGGVGSIFWLIIVSFIVSINTYIECILGIKYREKEGNSYIGGPSYYIKKSLKNNHLALLYGFLVIITYSGLFLSIQSNTIVSTITYFNIKPEYIIIILFLTTLFIITKGVKGISTVNTILVPIMLIFYLILGIYVLINNLNILPNLLKNIINEAFNLKSIIPVFLIGMQRAIFITESTLGTSAISASSCDNDPKRQGLLEVLGIHITTLLVCLTTFLIIATSNYDTINFQNINGIEIVLYAFNYHFGKKGSLFLTIITILFAFSTIISSYFFGESNINIFSKNKHLKNLFKTVFLLIIIISCYIKPSILWNLTDYFIAILAIINVYSILKITNKNKI